MTDERIRLVVQKMSDALATEILRCEPLTYEALRLATALTKIVDELNDEVETLKVQVARLKAANDVPNRP